MYMYMYEQSNILSNTCCRNARHFYCALACRRCGLQCQGCVPWAGSDGYGKQQALITFVRCICFTALVRYVSLPVSVLTF